MSVDHLLKRMSEQKAAATSKFLEPGGKYLLEVQATKVVEGFKANYACAEVRVIKAEAMEPGAKVTPAGSTASYLEDIDKKDSNGGGRFKAFLMAATQKGEEDFDSLPKLAKYFGEKQPASFLLVEAEAFTGTIKGGPNAGKPITKIKFNSYDPTDDEFAAIVQKRAAAKLPTLEEALG